MCRFEGSHEEGVAALHRRVGVLRRYMSERRYQHRSQSPRPYVNNINKAVDPNSNPCWHPHEPPTWCHQRDAIAANVLPSGANHRESDISSIHRGAPWQRSSTGHNRDVSQSECLCVGLEKKQANHDPQGGYMGFLVVDRPPHESIVLTNLQTFATVNLASSKFT